MTEDQTMMLTARVPIWLVAEATELAAKTGRTRTQIVTDALAAYVTPIRTLSQPEQQEVTK